jgi:hypothetical protein
MASGCFSSREEYFLNREQPFLGMEGQADGKTRCASIGRVFKNKYILSCAA